MQIFKAGTQTPTLELQYENGTYFVELSGPNYSPSHVSNLSAGTATAAGIEFASLQDVPQTLTYSYNIDWAYGTEYMEVTATIDSGIPQNPVPINETTFPDTIWRDYVTANFDADSDGYLSEQEAEAVTIVEVDSMSITDLTGIAYFTNLTVLYCGANLLTSLDISGNTALTELYASFNRLTSLDVSNNTALTLLECDINYLTSLDVSNNTALTSLYCSFNRLDALDISSNTILRNLDCSGNFLTELDLSANTDLQALRCHSNFLTELDLSNITDLNELFCSGNRLTELDVSGFPNLTYLLCTNNYLSALDVSANTNLYDSLDAGSQYPTYDITEINGAYYFEITDSGYSPSRVSNLSAGTATATGIRFDSLNDVPDSFTYSYDPEWSEEPVIIDVTVTNEGLIAIDAQNFPDNVCRAGVTLFDANSDGFLSLQERATITSMAPSNLPISDLTGIEYFPNLQMLFGYDDALTFLDLSSNTKLLAILCQNNQLATLDFSNNPDVILFMTSPQTPTLELQYENGTYFVELPGPNYSPSRVSNLSAGTATAAGIEFASLQDVPETLTYSYDIDWAYGTEYMEVTATIDDNIPQSPVPINATTFPDAIWRAYVAANYDTDSDGYLSSYERLVVSSVDVSAMGIEDLTGIVYFSNLDRLECYENALTALDISGNGALTFLDCSYNELAALDISGNTALETLNYSYNDLPAVDLSNNTALLMFACMGNGITSFDPSILPNLKYLAIAQNPIGSLDISSNQDLEVLLAVENNLTSLDVSNNLLLETLFISSNNFTAIDVSQNTNLLWLNCASNPITELDLSNNTALTSLNCPYNALATLDLSANPNLTTIFLTVQDQQTTLPLQYENGEYFIALPGINYSPTRVLVLSAGTATAAGIVFDSLDDVPDTLTYSYNTQHPSKTLLMNVTVTVDKSAF
ncbi:MAG: hypothetical protein LBS36_00775 [Oscillospiraceae bacterium]|nr:hypothetical protein [Oscillospiraceae bacterium]